MLQFVLNALAFLFSHTAGVEHEDPVEHASLGEQRKQSQLVGKKPFPIVRLWLS